MILGLEPGYPVLIHIENRYLGYLVAFVINTVGIIVSIVIAALIVFLALFAIIYSCKLSFPNGTHDIEEFWDALWNGDKLSKSGKELLGFMLAVSGWLAGLYTIFMIAKLIVDLCPTTIMIYIKMEMYWFLSMLAILVTAVLFQLPIWFYRAWQALRALRTRSHSEPDPPKDTPLADLADT